MRLIRICGRCHTRFAADTLCPNCGLLPAAGRRDLLLIDGEPQCQPWRQYLPLVRLKLTPTPHAVRFPAR